MMDKFNSHHGLLYLYILYIYIYYLNKLYKLFANIRLSEISDIGFFYDCYFTYISIDYITDYMICIIKKPATQTQKCV